jgi:hypothetical protein
MIIKSLFGRRWKSDGYIDGASKKADTKLQSKRSRGVHISEVYLLLEVVRRIDASSSGIPSPARRMLGTVYPLISHLIKQISAWDYPVEHYQTAFQALHNRTRT